jgi:uncharacterized protein
LIKFGAAALKKSCFLPVSPGNAAPEVSRPAADKVLSGDPVHTAWNLEDREGLYAGIWESTPGKWRISYDEWEFCHVLSGVSVIIEEGGKEIRVSAGDSFVLQPGFKGTWEVIETTRKEYVIKL